MKRVMFITVTLITIYIAGFFTQAAVFITVGIDINKYLYSPWVSTLDLNNPVRDAYNKSVEYWCNKFEECTNQ